MKKYTIILALSAMHASTALEYTDYSKKFKSYWQYASPTLLGSATGVGLGTLGYLAYQLHKGNLNSWDVPVLVGGAAAAGILGFASNLCKHHTLELKNKFRKKNFSVTCEQLGNRNSTHHQDLGKPEYVATEAINESMLWPDFRDNSFLVALTSDKVIKKVIDQEIEHRKLIGIKIDNTQCNKENINNLLDEIPKYSIVIISLSQGLMKDDDFYKILDEIEKRSTYTKKFLVVGDMSEAVSKKYIATIFQVSKKTDLQGNTGGYRGLAEDYFDKKIGKEPLNWVKGYWVSQRDLDARENNKNQLNLRKSFINNICKIAVNFHLGIDQFLKLLEIINQKVNNTDNVTQKNYLDQFPNEWRQYNYWQWNVINNIYKTEIIEFLVNVLNKNREQVVPITDKLKSKYF